MGLYERDYYREDPRSLSAWMPGRVTVGLIALMVGVFVLQLLGKGTNRGHDVLYEQGSLSADAVMKGEVWRLITSPLVHETRADSGSLLLSFALTTLLFYLFGRRVEDDLGGPEFLRFLLAATAVSQVLELLFQLSGLLQYKSTAGPAGPILATLVLHACRHPNEIWRFFLILPIPMWAIAVAVVGMSMIRFGVQATPIVPLAGTVFALAYSFGQMRFTRSAFPKRPLPRFQPRLQVVPELDEDAEETGSYAPVPPRADSKVDEQLEAKVDFVLQKVAQFGRGSLSAEENAVLMKASEVYRKRRPT